MNDHLTDLAEDQDEVVDFVHAGQSFKMRKRFKRLKFLRTLQSDPTAAIEMAFGPEEYARIEDLDMDEDEFSGFMTAFAARFTGSQGNSSPSPA